MKYWKRLNDCGSMDDGGYVPDSVEVSKEMYDEYVNNCVVVKYIDSDMEKLIKYAKKEKWIE